MLNLSTQELIHSRLRLHEDVVVTPVRKQGEVVYQLESKQQGRFFSIGYAEYLFCSLLDGRTTLAEAATLAARALGADAFNEREAVSISSWLIDNGLATPMQRAGLQRTTQAMPRSRWSLNPFWMKFPLLNPDKLVQTLVPILGGLFSFPVFCLALLLFGWSGILLVGRWEEFAAASSLLFVPQNWLWMGLIWIALKLVHEFAHAISCRRYGGQVREMGLVFILFAPIAYVDVTSSWAFPSRWRRMAVAAAGMYIELIVAAIAIILWCSSDNPVLRFVLYQTIVMAGVTTVLFNANPLMRFDGYYILSDLLGIPNLYTQGSKASAQWLGRLVWGHGSPSKEVRGWEARLLVIYGLLSGCWRVLVTISLTIAAAVLFAGAGLVLAGIGVVMFAVPLLRQLFGVLNREWREHPLALVRGLVVLGSVATMVGLIVFYLPCPGTNHAPGIIEYQDLQVIRPETPGFVARMLVREGDEVTAGEILAELRNEELDNEVADLKLAIAQSQSRHRKLTRGGEISAAQVEARNQRTLQERLDDRLTRQAGLKVIAKESGRIVGHRLGELVGTYLDEGAELLAIGREQSKEIQVSIPQAALEVAEASLGTERTVRVPGVGLIQGEVERLVPRASVKTPHAALLVPYGGDLAVMIDRQKSDNEEISYLLTEPRFLMTIPLSETDSRRVHAGQRAALQLGFGSRSIAQVTYAGIQRWLREKFQLAKESA
ncbi:MAG: biotin/lipoyl-binding protein [Planctomycetaceae bacterium]|nr:biotin/lipoyl-binding protein [Planctomycetaceae bacterium]